MISLVQDVAVVLSVSRRYVRFQMMILSGQLLYPMYKVVIRWVHFISVIYNITCFIIFYIRNAVRINGRLTLRGITQPITVNAFLIRNAFQGTTSFYLSDFGINGLLGFMFAKLHLTMRIEAGR